MNIKSNLEKIKSNISKDIKVIAVSKTKSNNEILEAYNCGQLSFGENKVQELIKKSSVLPKDIEWHFIGPIQSNKCKAIAENFSWVQTVDRIKIANRLNQYRSSSNPLNVCLQINISNEPTKSGMHIDEVEEFAKIILKILFCFISGDPLISENKKSIFRLLHINFSSLSSEADTMK